MSSSATKYPEYVDSKPPVVTLAEYDEAPWAGTTCVDSRDDEYVVVDMQKPEQVVARIAPSDNKTLDTIFKSAKKTFVDNVAKETKEKAQKK